jgi:AbrB family looped-hinge helix DNA binding protein
LTPAARHLFIPRIDAGRRGHHFADFKEVSGVKGAVSRITSKGLVTIPEEIRRQYQLQAGEQIEWEVTESETIEVRRAGGSLDDLVKSCLDRSGR